MSIKSSGISRGKAKRRKSKAARSRPRPRITTRFATSVSSAWAPPPAASCREWVPANIVIPSDTETGGPFDLDLFPHVAEVLDAVDDPAVRKIYLPWAARNAKTTTSLSCLAFLVAKFGRPAVFASSDEERADDTIQNQLYPMLEESPELRALLLPKHKRSRRAVVLGRTRIRRAFSGSVSTLAGFPACYGLASEVSKWSSRKSSEAHPVHLIAQRGKLFPFDSKFLYEGTPGTAGRCVITRLCDNEGTQRRFRFVPCPHCGQYQRLTWGDESADSPGVKWESPKRGGSKAAAAEASAWYRCENGCRIDDADRPEMLRGGVWLAEGERIEGDAIVGEPHVGPAAVAFCDLSTLYSLLISGWGQLAREWIEAQGDPERIRDFLNSTLARTWDPTPRSVQPSDLAKRLADPTLRRGELPPWAAFLTLGVDVGVVGEMLVFYWLCGAWGPTIQHRQSIPRKRGHVVEWGECWGDDEFQKLIGSLQFGGLRPKRIGVDSGDGNITQRIYEICAGSRLLTPLKGSTGSTGVDLYQWGMKRAGVSRQALKAKRRGGRGDLLVVDTPLSQSWRDNLVAGRVKAKDADFCSLPAELLDDPLAYAEFLDELAADYKDEGDRWDNEGRGPNEYGDAWRYSRVLAELETRGGKLWDQLERSTGDESAAAEIPAANSRPNSPPADDGDRRKRRRRKLRRR